MAHIKVEKVNEAYIRLFSDRSTEQELSEFFKFESPGGKFSPKYKAGLWDGKIRMFNLQTKMIYSGLINYVIEFATTHQHTLEIDDGITYNENINIDYVEGFAKVINPCSKGNPIEMRDYQLEAIQVALNNRKVVLSSPTASGKSALIYILLRWFIAKNMKVLIIVPTTSLVEQLYNDFEDYSTGNKWVVEDNCQKLYSGLSKDITTSCLITTWQSSWKNKSGPGAQLAIAGKDWFNQWDAVICDECVHPDTLVTTASGQIKISNISDGDLILTFNEDTQIYEYRPVLKVHKNLSIIEKKFKITYSDGTYIIITGNHKQYTQRGWVRTDELLCTDCVLSFID